VNQDELKRQVAYEAVNDIQDGMTIGIGTGSTMRYVLLLRHLVASAFLYSEHIFLVC